MLGLTTKRRLMREVTQAAQAYRWERDEALKQVRKSEQKYQDLLDRIFPRSSVLENHWAPERQQKIVIEVDEHGFRTPFGQADWEYIGQKIMTDLQRAHRDYRADLREVMPEGIGGPEKQALKLPLECL